MIQKLLLNTYYAKFTYFPLSKALTIKDGIAEDTLNEEAKNELNKIKEI